MNSICVLAVYFGNMPTSFEPWLRSCAENPQIDFLIVTDRPVKARYSNVRVLIMSLAQMKALAEDKLGMKISLEAPYKVCDYRPAFGEIFSESLAGYEYWGHCDMDMVFGDLWGILNARSYREYDKFLVWGHLSFYRNTPEVNGRYRLSGSRRADYDVVFTEPENYIFDELNGIYRIYQTHCLPVFPERIFADIYSRYTQFKMVGEQPAKKHQLYYWENGRVMRAWVQDGEVCAQEYLYLHFQKRRLPAPDFDVFSCSGFFVTPDGFIEKTRPGVPDVQEIETLNPYLGEAAEKESLRAFNARLRRERIKRVFGRYRRKLFGR